MGSLYRRKRTKRDGRVERDDHYTISYRNENGKWVTEPGYTDKKASQAKLTRAEERVARLREGLRVPLSVSEQERRSWKAAVEAYRSDRERLGRSAAYLAQTVQQIEATAEWCGWGTVAEMRADRFREFLAALASGKVERKKRPHDKQQPKPLSASPKTVNAYRDAVVGFGAWCVGQGWLEVNPLAGVPKSSLGQPGDTSRRPRARRALNVAEYRSLVACQKVKAWRRDLYAVAGLSGLRADELNQLAPCDFTLGDKPRWHLRPEVTKAGRLDRIPMLPECAAELARLADGKGLTDRIFPRRPHPRTVEADILRAGIAKRDERGRQADMHSLRYFFCTLIGRVLPIQRVRQLMRHRDIRTTVRLYLDLGIDDIAETLETLPPLLAGAK